MFSYVIECVIPDDDSGIRINMQYEADADDAHAHCEKFKECAKQLGRIVLGADHEGRIDEDALPLSVIGFRYRLHGLRHEGGFEEDGVGLCVFSNDYLDSYDIMPIILNKAG